MAAFVVVSSLLELVEQQLLQPNPFLVLNDTETVVSLRDKLHFLQAFLEESELKTEDPEAKEKLESEIQDVATKAEGQIGSKLRLLYLAANANANANGGDECLVEVACQQLYQTMQQVLKDIKAVEVRILMLKPNFLFTSSTNDIKVGVSSPSDLIPEDTPIVGFDDEARTIMNMLIYKGSPLKREVIAICGMGGHGKTTLAQMVYEDPQVRYYFDIRAWTVVSREHNVKEMLIHLLDCILPVITTEISNKSEAELAEQLRKSLVVNLLKNWDFEEGPYVFPKVDTGVLCPPFTEDDHSPLPAWTVESLKAVKYIDAEHFSVPHGRRAVELVAGKESAVTQIARTIAGKFYDLTFLVGDASNKCEGSMVVEAFAGPSTLKVPYESKGQGGFKPAKLRFRATANRTRVMFFSTYYHTRSDDFVSLCGPVVDFVKLVSVRNPHRRLA